MGSEAASEFSRGAGTEFARALIEWHGRRGRHDLPWQREQTPYRVWISEIMLQQTQVATVIPYYERFMQRFPDVRALAGASLDEVLGLWSGLGYYARARNLHRAAVRIVEEYGGQFPERFEDVASLPGIGRSTAGAILALSRGERHAILDGNVRRVLCRFFGIEGDPSQSAVNAELWQRSDGCTPESGVATYTQAIMDLGATVCTRRRPLCAGCPFEDRCEARRTGRQHELPAARTARRRGARHTFMLLAAREDGRVLLLRRPPSGIWGGLWCLPEFEDVESAGAFAAQYLRAARSGERESASALAPMSALACMRPLGQIEHAFTHFDLTITPLYLECAGAAGRTDPAGSLGPASTASTAGPVSIAGVADAPDEVWYDVRQAIPIGLPAPVRALLEQLDRFEQPERSEAQQEV